MSEVFKVCKTCKQSKSIDCFKFARTYYYRECKNCQSRKDYETRDKKKAHLNSLRHKCKAKGIPFNLDVDDLSTPDVCPAIGVHIKQTWGNSEKRYGEDFSPSLDKFIPELGYVKGNVRVISNLANRIKTNSSIEQVEGVLRYMKQCQAEQVA